MGWYAGIPSAGQEQRKTDAQGFAHERLHAEKHRLEEVYNLYQNKEHDGTYVWIILSNVMVLLCLLMVEEEIIANISIQV